MIRLLAPAALALMLTATSFAGPDFSVADRAIEKAIADHQTPGAVLLVGKGADIVYERAYGNLTYEPPAHPMTPDTVFDLASLSKSVGCATSVLILADRGKIDLDAPVATYIPEFGNNGKERITVEMLLLHRGGLIADNPMSDYTGHTPAEALAAIFASKPKEEPGTKFIYSDVGFIVLGELVHRVSGQPLDVFAQQNIFDPLGMTETSYHPPAALREQIAPTQKRDGHWMIGEAHDPRAYALGGFAGHAGVFGTARDLAKWLQMLNHGGERNGTRILSEAMVKRMLTMQTLPDGTGGRGLGVDMNSSFSSCRGKRFAAGTTFGHTGYTGTMYWSDPVNDVFFVLLTNRVHPDDKADIKRLRADVATAAGEALLGPAPATQPAQ